MRPAPLQELRMKRQTAAEMALDLINRFLMHSPGVWVKSDTNQFPSCTKKGQELFNPQ